MTNNLQKLIEESAYYGSLPVEIRGEREIKMAKVIEWYTEIIQAIYDEDDCNIHDIKAMAENGLKVAEQIAGGAE